jgi:hypothetical protein
MEGFIKITAIPDGDTGCRLVTEAHLKKVNKLDRAQLLRLFIDALEMDKAEVFSHMMLMPVLEAADKDDDAAEKETAAAESCTCTEDSTCNCGDTCRSDPNIGKYCIIRGESSGVFAGVLTAHNGREVTLSGCRRLWFWDGAASISQIAAQGVTKPGKCKFTVTVDSLSVLDAIEIIPTTAEAESCIKAVPVWKM